MKKYVISVWNSIATLFIEVESEETLKYEKVEIPSKLAHSVQEFINSQVDLSKSLIYPLNKEAIEKLGKLGLAL